jgi:hypothetical protein
MTTTEPTETPRGTTAELLGRVHELLGTAPKGLVRLMSVGTAVSEVVGDTFQVSVRNAEDDTTAIYYYPVGEMTHRQAVALAVNALTGRTVTHVRFVRRVGDGASELAATVE